jgi:hypothetical protein
MKLFSNVIAITFASFLFTNASAVTPAATPVQPYAKVNKPAAWQVAVINNDNYDYTSYASYLPSHIIWDTYLGPYGAPTDEIYYSYGVPNYCYNIIRNIDGLIAYVGCLKTGTITLYPPLDASDKKLAKSTAAPIIKITQ